MRRSLTSRCQSRNRTEPLITLGLEKQLAPELLAVLIEPRPELSLSPIDLTSLQLHRNCLVRLASDDEILVVWVWLLDSLFVGAHEADAGDDTSCDIGKLKLKEQTILARDRVADLRDAITWSSDLQSVLLDLYARKQSLLAHIVPPALTLLLCGTTCQVGLMLPPLCMCEIRAVVLVDCQAQPAFKASDVVLEEVRVLVEVDCLKCELAEAFPTVGICG